MCAPRLYDGITEDDYPDFFGNEVYDEPDEDASDVQEDTEKVKSTVHEDNLFIYVIFYFLIIFHLFKFLHANKKDNEKRERNLPKEDISIKAAKTAGEDVSMRIDNEEETPCPGNGLDDKDTSINKDRTSRNYSIYQAFLASLKSSFVIKYEDRDEYEEDGLDPGKLIYEMSKKTTMKGQWTDVGCESTEDIINHMKKCKCNLDCPVLDCRYLARVPDEWPDRLPEDVIVCRRDHGSQQYLLIHSSEYGCDPLYVQGGDCGVLGCRITEALLVHLKNCHANEKCDVPKCWYFRQLRSHWEECSTHIRFCFLCSENKLTAPEPRSHIYLPMFL